MILTLLLTDINSITDKITTSNNSNSPTNKILTTKITDKEVPLILIIKIIKVDNLFPIIEILKEADHTQITKVRDIKDKDNSTTTKEEHQTRTDLINRDPDNTITTTKTINKLLNHSQDNNNNNHNIKDNNNQDNKMSIKLETNPDQFIMPLNKSTKTKFNNKQSKPQQP